MACSQLRACCKDGISHFVIFLLPHFQDGLGHSIQPSSAFLNSTETLQSQSYNQNHFSGEKYRVIHKSLRNFRTRLRNNQDRHDRKEHMSI